MVFKVRQPQSIALQDLSTLPAYGAHAMTTFTETSPLSTDRHPCVPDFVSSDSAALASHMSHCAQGRSRFFDLHAAWESGHALLCTRMVTFALIAVAVVGLLALVGTV